VNDLLIYGAKGSPFVRKPQVMLAEKGVAYDIEGVMPFSPPEWFHEISPAKRIPVLRDRQIGSEGREGTIPDSSAICAYIERKHPDPALYPEDPFDFARAVWIEEYADTELATRVGLGIFRPIVISAMMGREPDVEKARKTLHEDLPPVFDYLESLAKNREFMLGDAFGIADISVATQFVNLRHAGGRVDPERWPALADLVARAHARASFAHCIEDEEKIFKPGATL